VFGFRSSSSLASAYGVAVTMTMAITTILLYLVARQRWSWSVPKAALVCAPLLAVDLAFLGANVFKIPSGGWFPLLVGAALFVALTTWRKGRDLVAASIRADAPRLDELLTSFAAKPPARVEGTAVYLHREGGLVPPALMSNLRSSHVVHRHVVLLSVLTDKQAHVPGAQRLSITAMGQGFFQAVIRVGYADFVDVPAVLESSVDSRVSFLAEDTTYFLGSERVLPTPGSGMALWRERLFALMARNAGSAARFFRLPVDRVVEIGRQVEI
jgi:KUP system potassium uptake protein